MTDLLDKLRLHRPVFHSEKDFQHSLAWLIHQQDPDAQIRLETPLTVQGPSLATSEPGEWQEMPEDLLEPAERQAGRASLDLAVIDRSCRRVAIELKYTKPALQATPSN